MRRAGVGILSDELSLPVLCYWCDLLSLIVRNLPLSRSLSCSRKPVESFSALDAKCSRSAHILEASVTKSILRVSEPGREMWKAASSLICVCWCPIEKIKFGVFFSSIL